MNIMRRVAQLLLDINKIQTEAKLEIFGRLGIYRRLYIACGFPEDAAVRLEQQFLALGHEGVAEQHEIVSRLIRAELNLEQFVDQWARWCTGYAEYCHEVALDEAHCLS